MKVLHVYNSHRGGGGSDNAWAETIRLAEASGMDIRIFARDSKSLTNSTRDKAMAALSGVYGFRAGRDIEATIAQFEPDLMHTHELYPLISPWVLRRAADRGVPVVHTCYDFRLTCPVATHFQNGATCHQCLRGREYRAVLNNCRKNRAESVAYAARNAVARYFDLFGRYVSQFIVLTEFSRQWLIEKLGIAATRVSVNPPAIACSDSPADAATGNYIAYAGRFVPEKGVENLIEAARKTGLPVRLAGDAPTHPAIRPGDPVTCVMTRSRAELMQFYRNARMLVVPSLWYETFGIVAAEAMGHAIPVIASRIGALQDVVVDGVTGRLFAPHSVDGLADQMQRLWDMPEQCRSMGAAGYARVRTEYSAAAHLRRLSAVYDMTRA